MSLTTEANPVHIPPQDLRQYAENVSLVADTRAVIAAIEMTWKNMAILREEERVKASEGAYAILTRLILTLCAVMTESAEESVTKIQTLEAMREMFRIEAPLTAAIIEVAQDLERKKWPAS